jgi:hypothetical protein
LAGTDSLLLGGLADLSSPDSWRTPTLLLKVDGALSLEGNKHNPGQE